MAISRLKQAGAELQSALAELDEPGSAAISNTKARSGSYSFQQSVVNPGRFGFSLPSGVSQFRASFHLNHNGPRSTTDNADLVSWFSDATLVGRLRYNGTNGLLELLVGSSVVASISAAEAGINTVDVWYHIGVDVKLHGTGGWVYVYRDGNLILSFDGDTLGTTGATTVNRVLFGAHGVGYQGWEDYVYFDDLYVDSTEGETGPGVVPDRRFVLLTPDGNGSYSQFTGSDGDQVDNYLLVDDAPHDEDTTYVKATASGLIDTYAMTTFTIPQGWQVAALIPVAVARKMAAEDDTQVRLAVKSGGSLVQSAPKNLGTSYEIAVWHRQESDPATGLPWSQSGIDNVEVGVVSEGTFV